MIGETPRRRLRRQDCSRSIGIRTQNLCDLFVLNPSPDAVAPVPWESGRPPSGPPHPTVSSGTPLGRATVRSRTNVGPTFARSINGIRFQSSSDVGFDRLLRAGRIVVADDRGPASSVDGRGRIRIAKAVDEREAGPAERSGRCNFPEQLGGVGGRGEEAAVGFGEDDVEVARIGGVAEREVVVAAERFHELEVDGVVEVAERVDVMVGHTEAASSRPGAVGRSRHRRFTGGRYMGGAARRAVRPSGRACTHDLPAISSGNGGVGG